MSTTQNIIRQESEISYFALDVDAELTPVPFVSEIDEDNIFVIDLTTGDISPSAAGEDDSFFEIVGGEITPKVL